MTRTKNNPKLSHDQWLLVQKEQIKMITKLQEDKDELKRRVKELEEALKKNEEVKEENEKMNSYLTQTKLISVKHRKNCECCPVSQLNVR